MQIMSNNEDKSTTKKEHSNSKKSVELCPVVANQAISLKVEPYLGQGKKYWPKDGRHILAQFDANTIVVYQAFNPAITDYAIKHQSFGGDSYSFERMSWIKPNFLWMMYRSGWASKESQKHILAVRIKCEGFEEILANAYTPLLQKSEQLTKEDIEVRLQWDPDHTPDGGKEKRRAIQLGLKGKILQKYATEWIVQIEDITTFVREQHQLYLQVGEDCLLTPSERVYPIMDQGVANRIQLDSYEDPHNHPALGET